MVGTRSAAELLLYIFAHALGFEVLFQEVVEKFGYVSSIKSGCQFCLSTAMETIGDQTS
jgi:hypothetical protein